MSVNPETAGVTAKHIADIERVCRELNTFIFLRPSTKETMQLIDQGYATKSMDIHDKSSDWGPASGFVPCDGAFSKAV
jgi:anthrax edema toxin adenylate cyclase